MVWSIASSGKHRRSKPLSLSMVLIGLLVLIVVPECLSFQPWTITTSTTTTTAARHGCGGIGSTTSMMLNFFAPQQQQQQHSTCLLAKRSAPKNKGGGSGTSNSNNKSGSSINTPERAERIRKPRDDVIEVEATVQESLPNAMFRCSINSKGSGTAANGATTAVSSSSSSDPPASTSGTSTTSSSSNQPLILATISGKIRQNMVKILVGDRVLIELSPYDLTRGRITFRYRS